MSIVKRFDMFILESTDLTIAKEIARQLGSKALFMMGAKNLVGDERSLTFKFSGCAEFNYIKIELNSLDLYDITFMKIWKDEITKKETVEGVYNDMLHQIISSKTKLALKL